MQQRFYNNLKKAIRLITLSFLYSGLFLTFIASASAASDEIPIWNKIALTFTTNFENLKDQQAAK